MKIVIAPDSFKGSLSSCQAAIAINKGVRKVIKHANTILVPVADGGEGTRDSLVAATGGYLKEIIVHDSMGDHLLAEYGILGDNQTCVIEISSNSDWISKNMRDPMQTTTFGSGELIRHALNCGYRRFIIALGGSDTNDGGIGMLQALGMRIMDSCGEKISPGSNELMRVSAMDDSSWDPRIRESHFTIASDMLIPLTGPYGIREYSGMLQVTAVEIDGGLLHWADRIEAHTGKRIHELPGAGAAGGLGAAFQAFFPSKTRRGIDLVMELTGLREQLQGADLVITGEGQVDAETCRGKAPMGIAQKAQKLGIPVVVLAGSIGSGFEPLYQHGVSCIHSIADASVPLPEAMRNAASLLEKKAEQVTRTFLGGQH